MLVLVGDPHGSYLSMRSFSTHGSLLLTSEPLIFLGHDEFMRGAFFVQTNGAARLNLADSSGVVHSFPPVASSVH